MASLKEVQKPIPISTARGIAKNFGWDQVIILARKVGDDGGEHITTYGVGPENCNAAARIGEYLKFKVLGWVSQTVHEDLTKRVAPEKLAAALDRLYIHHNGSWNERDKFVNPTKWFVVDESTAEPDVNFPGDLMGEFDSREAAEIGLAKAALELAEKL